jgi:hypothetical protein
MGEEKDPKPLRVLLNRLNGFALSKRERPQVEDLLRKAYEAGLEEGAGSGFVVEPDTR